MMQTVTNKAAGRPPRPTPASGKGHAVASSSEAVNTEKGLTSEEAGTPAEAVRSQRGA